MEGEQNNEGPANNEEIDLHSSGDTGFLGWSSPNTVEHEVSTTDDRNSLENEVSRVSSPVGVDRDEGLIAFMRTMMNSLNEKMDKNNEELKKNNEELKKNNEELRKDLNEKMDKNNEGLRDLNYKIDQNNEELKTEIQRSNEQLKRDMEQMKDRDRANLELDQDGENGKASKDVENKSITGSSLQEIEDMGNRVEKSLNKRLDETLGKLENKQTQLENMMRNQSMVLIILKYMKNEAGKWGRQHINNWKNFEQFYRSFKEKYWSIGEQKKFEKELMGNGTYRVGFDNLVTYVLEFYNKSQYLETRIDMGTFLAYIRKHVPRTISSAIAAAQNVERSEDLENLLNQLNILNSDTNRSYDRSFDMRNETTLNRNVNQYKNLRPRDAPYRGTQVRGNIRGNNLTRVGSYYNRDTYNRERVEFENDRRRQSNNRGRDTNDYGKEKERHENNETRHQRDQYEYTRGRGSMRGNR
ncbi:hypothetical protein J6590_065197 [Homalodisca vitripennis]|nr:hypothetical protein J6590_065197 [Homalodisca vitripennis]